MRATIKVNCLPIGQYTCDFDGIECVDSQEYGPGWRWKFVVTAGKFCDRECSRITSNNPTPKNACGRFLAALAGEVPRDGMALDTDEFIGRQYAVMIEATQNGDSTRVGSFAPIATDAMTRPTPAPVETAADLPSRDTIPF